MTRTVKLAVVGTALAGLTAAHLLKRPLRVGYVKFEAPLVGMGSSSISLAVPGFKEDWRVDVPMRSFKGGYYSHLITSYKSLGVVFRQADLSYYSSSLFVSKNLRRLITSTTIYNGVSGRAGVSKPSSLGGTRKTLGVLASAIQRVWVAGLFICLTAQLLLCYLITLLNAMPTWRSTSISSTLFRDWVAQTKPRGFLAKWRGMNAAWQDYINSVLLPMLSVVWRLRRTS